MFVLPNMNVGKKLYFQVKTILDIPTSTKL